MISDERKERSLIYLAETDEACADLEGDVARKEYMLDLIKDRVFLTADGNNAERQAIANTSGETTTAHEVWAQALVKLKHMKAKRTTEALVIDVWRSENANRRQG